MPLKNDDFVLKYGHLFCNSRYDAKKTIGGMMEHIPTFAGFVAELRTSLIGTVACLADGAWLVVHCGPMRDQSSGRAGSMCDIPFEVKKILEAIDGVWLQDEIVCVPPFATAMMRASLLFRNKSHLTNHNTRMVVAWKGRESEIPSGNLEPGGVYASQPLLPSDGGQLPLATAVKRLPPQPPVRSVGSVVVDEDHCHEHAQFDDGSQPSADQWITSGSEWVGRQLLRKFDRGPPVLGTVTKWLPKGSGKDEPALHKMIRADGDAEDLEEEEVRNAHKALLQVTLRPAPVSAGSAAQGVDMGSADQAVDIANVNEGKCQFAVGAKVCHRFHGSGWHHGEVIGFHCKDPGGRRYPLWRRVRFDDGDVLNVKMIEEADEPIEDLMSCTSTGSRALASGAAASSDESLRLDEGISDASGVDVAAEEGLFGEEKRHQRKRGPPSRFIACPAKRAAGDDDLPSWAEADASTESLPKKARRTAADPAAPAAAAANASAFVPPDDRWANATPVVQVGDKILYKFVLTAASSDEREQWFAGTVKKCPWPRTLAPGWWTVHLSAGLGIRPGTTEKQIIKLTVDGFRRYFPQFLALSLLKREKYERDLPLISVSY